MTKLNKSSIDFPNPQPCPFAEMVIHTKCDAFLTDDPELPYEARAEEDLPAVEIYHRIIPEMYKGVKLAGAGTVEFYTQGQYHYVGGIVADLKLVCDDYDRRGIEYHLLWDNVDEDFVLWVPKLEHMTSGIVKGEPKVEEFEPLAKELAFQSGLPHEHFDEDDPQYNPEEVA